ncbi:MAG: tRNA (adenosine(37)-N6)-threonylcarbamoyltransferase complex transferase subunit TsaD [Armatimonadota bacterium]|nr:tRNA (adenosine(37)-N6)-threonylcarbamoyltransferase complex transferase subunit TsaD [Armatimonadota bacterium]MCX7776979.1 tRNA (adenosine(37)-N6)-threonylcarbamoyltransferase complex transferase subunit TsaD [Armatimonadota bacterium]MDW8024813.1 tRNA (adenosine(37)-N6)-threonylcarbamoyltransferase complex transferase subunit TsaD [Armatimonadota bacterium]
MVVLGIETSCDETSVALVRDGRTILSNIVCSQADWHKHFGGIVPEIASRKHVELLFPALDLALKEASVELNSIDGVAVTCGPGLISSLAVGLAVAKAICAALNKPLIPVNHLEGHMLSAFLADNELDFPFLCLIVSGGHSELVYAHDLGKYEVLGRTRDDAAGEAFDKVARVLGLGFPGGPAIDKAATNGSPSAIAFPRADMGGSLDFSFAGLKTAVARFVEGYRDILADKSASQYTVPDIAASFQEAVVDMLIQQTERAIQMTKANALAVVGGVAANRRLRQRMNELTSGYGIKLVIPPIILCTDNAAMTACAGYYRLERGLTANLDVDAIAVWDLEDVTVSHLPPKVT